LVESLSLKKNDIVLGNILEELKILFQGSGIEADGGPYAFGFQIGEILKYTVPAGGDRKTLNQE
jgi:hypothetical protein